MFTHLLQHVYRAAAMLRVHAAQRTLNRTIRSLFALAAYAICGLLWLPSLVDAAELQGQVVDESTLTPLFRATVKVERDTSNAAPIWALTDASGGYRLAGLSGGNHHVTFSYIGYATVTRHGLAVGENDTVRLDVALVPHAIDMDAIVVSASRRPEKHIEAPSSVVLLNSSDIQSRVALTGTDHLQNLPAVDASSTGLNSSNVVVRGFNNVLSTTLLSMVDNRLSQIPSLRVNAYQFATIPDEEIDHVELVLGPGSALYGPNASAGVMHVITKSPFASKGGSVSVAGGERDLAMGSIRYAGTAGNRLGFRACGQYYRAFDWQVYDSSEPDSIWLYRPGPEGNDSDASGIDNRRDFEVEKFAGDIRGDLLLSDDGVLILGAGLSQASNIELTDFGAAQVRDWRYGYLQIRSTYKNLFAQAHMNFTDAGDTYLRRNGARIVDRSRLYVGQVQHALSLFHRIHLTYGLDVLLTRPETEGTLHGGHEEGDDIDAFGAYGQMDVPVSSKVSAVGAIRVDRDNVIEGPVYSPRLAVSYLAGEHQNLRVSYNKAFSTPSTADFFSDILLGTLPIIDSFSDTSLGTTQVNIRAEGSADGFRFRRGADTRPQMVSFYGGVLEANGQISEPNSYLEPDVNSVWPAIRQILTNQDAGLDSLLPMTLGAQVPGVFASVNLGTTFDPVSVSSIQDVSPLDITATSTIEMGYTGRIGKRLAANADVYYTRKNDFVGPFRTETPNVWIDSASFVSTLENDIASITGDTALARSKADSVYQLVRDQPIGLVSPEEYQNATDAIRTRRNFGLVDVAGVDLAASFHLNPNWDLSGSYSYISENLFKNVDQIADVATNAPRHKFGGAVGYQSTGRRLNGQVQMRWVDGFPVSSGYYVGSVNRYFVFNLNLSHHFFKQTEVTLTVQNMFDNRHAEFFGAPELGRLAMVRLRQEW